MSKIAIITDSNSGVTPAEAKEMGVIVVPMPFFIDEKLYFEDIDLTKDEFFRILGDDGNVSTSQPSPGDLIDLWEKTLEEYDEIVHIPMSSGLSTSCATAMSLAQDYEGRVHVVDNQRISVSQKMSVQDALLLAKAGKSGAEIKQILTEEKLRASIYIMVDTLRRADHPGCGHAGYHAEIKACIADPGREAGRLRQSPRAETSEKNDARRVTA